MSRAVVLFLRAPVKGRVKTRLAADVGEERALVDPKGVFRSDLSERLGLT